MSLRKAYQSMIKVQGLPDTATLMELTESALDNRMYERKGQEFTVRQALRMQTISKTTLFAEAVAAESGGTFVKLPEVGEVDNDLLFKKQTELYAEIGELMREYVEFSKDGEIDEKEQVRMVSTKQVIHRKTEEMLGVMFMLCCQHGPRAE